MGEKIQEIGDKLTDINTKLDTVGAGLNSLVETLTSLGQTIESSLNGLVEKVNIYSEKITLQSQDDFDISKRNLEDVGYEINSIRTSMLGTSQIISMSESLYGLLEVLDTVAFDPKEVKLKFQEISEFIEEKKGGSK